MNEQNKEQKNVVVDWFGNSFIELHPLLQELHLHGGVLSGVVNLEYGSGVSGFIGKRLAAKMGLPTQSGQVDFEVDISHADGLLIWSRRFSKKYKMSSVFMPQGHYPNGYWCEMTGKLAIELGVDIREGGWYWIQREIRFKGILLPLCFFPSIQAYKRIKNGMYEFSVAFSFPFFGKLLSYSGLLTPCFK
jgi:Domain of unknown function (DUF4166)